MSARHDVVIVGGGLVGASLAIALDRLGRDVALVEATPPGQVPAVFDQRNLSLAAATVNALTALGVLQRLQAPTGPIRRIHVSRAGDFGRVLLQASDYGRSEFGQVVVARDFGVALEAALADCRHLTRYRPASFLGLAHDRDGLRQVRIDAGAGATELVTPLLVGADGSHSAVRAALGIGAQRHDYGQRLLVARVRTSRAPDGTAWERLGEAGPTALLPRGDRHHGLVHGVPEAQADAIAALDDAAWLAHAQAAFGWRAGRFLASGSRSTYPIVKVLAERVIAPRALLLGNAAQTLHPLGAQGFNLGLRDALTLAELIAAAEDPGSDALLAEYLQRRAPDRQRALRFSDGLARLTSNPAPLLRPLRSVGLLAAGNLPAVQSMLVGGAMGFAGDVPALCRQVAA
ncbi:2-octaprenyl-6-methoxyphenyl hydroxylase [Pseudoxanthomonas spadix]|uniref:2-octaprenyl-6-methoxyphenyl hydroxylase n=1 Tax=Pseudoxanthomonas spadix TaxID=415229 RepID=UPI000EFE5950|nr:2-octaprenyl-6-methoxyphenyl hydroxylase [Pseudoxanthomonas spadix]MBP3973551.1 2-octaprenyl-6-methoxyphenyl hydroxylase [Pseudoxanthomonas spadix]RMW95003.1 2-octaprenyl-6-methoxyphenyl hydroxylase [Pseudoxanthomonas spadix]